MATAKTTTITFRIEPHLKEALRTAADQDHRSIAISEPSQSPVRGQKITADKK